MILQGDCAEAMAAMDEASVDAIVTDPPYGLEFMGKEWDRLGPEASKGGNPALKPTRQHMATEPWEKMGARRPASYAPRKAARCKRCGGRSFGRPVPKCEGSCDWDTLTAEYARTMQEWHQAWATEALRILKPGGHLLAFGGTRTYHRLACAVEDAGFEIRDSLIWIYGSGFPKSLDVSKAIDKRRDWTLVDRLASEIKRARAEMGWSLGEVGERMLERTEGQYGRWYHRGGHMFFETGRSLPSRPEWEHLRILLPIAVEFQATYDEAERAVVGRSDNAISQGTGEQSYGFEPKFDLTAPATPEALKWQGWGTALKPAHEPIVVARKPLAGTVATNVLEHGTGALNVDGCRVEGTPEATRFDPAKHSHEGWRMDASGAETAERAEQAGGRWPANVTLSPEAAEELDRQSGERRTGALKPYEQASRQGNAFGVMPAMREVHKDADTGGASRFFYCAKASRGERNAGLDGFEAIHAPKLDGGEWTNPNSPGSLGNKTVTRQNHHPTVKPIDLMRWLVRLVTPPGGTVLDPFTGSGTTGIAATLEGFDFIGIEREAEYAEIARARIEWWSQFPPGTDIASALGLEVVDRVHRDSGQMGLFAG